MKGKIFQFVVRFMWWRARITIKRIILKKEFLKGQYLQLGPLPHSNHKLVPFLTRHAKGWQLKSQQTTAIIEKCPQIAIVKIKLEIIRRKWHLLMNFWEGGRNFHAWSERFQSLGPLRNTVISVNGTQISSSGYYGKKDQNAGAPWTSLLLFTFCCQFHNYHAWEVTLNNL